MRYKTIYFNASHFNGRIVRFTTSLISETYIAEHMMMSRNSRNTCNDFEFIRQLMGLPKPCYSKDGLRDFIEAVGASRLTPGMQDKGIGISKKAASLIPRIGFPRSRIAQTGLARHDVLLPRQGVDERDRTTIFVFLTWRDHWTGRRSRSFQRDMYRLNRNIVSDPAVQAFAEKNGLSIRVFLHHKIRRYSKMFSSQEFEHVKILDGDVNFEEEIRNTKILITDYSSVAFDFLIGGAAIVFYQPDFKYFAKSRGDFVSDDHGWIGPVVHHSFELSDAFERSIEQLNSQRERLLSEYPTFGNAREAIEKEIANLPPKVTFLCYNIYGIGGTVMSIVNSANYLFNKGYQVEIVCMRQTGETPKLDLHPSIPVKSLFESGFKGARPDGRNILSYFRSFLMLKNDDLFHRANALMDLRLIHHLRSTKSDVLIATTPSLASSAIRFARNSAAILVQEHKFFEAHHQSVQRRIVKHYGQAHAIACLTGQDAEEYGHITGRFCHVVSNGSREPEKPRSSHSVRRVIALGRLTPQKQFHLLIEAFSQARTGEDEWRLDIFGEGPEADNLRAAIGDLDLADIVSLRGPTSVAIEEIRDSDILAVSSTYEGFGMTLIEAYACGIPVITFDIERGPKETVQDGVTGLKAIPFSVEDYAVKLKRLMDDRALRQAMGEAGNKVFRERYSLEKAGRALEEAISGAVDQHGKNSERDPARRYDA
jgi:glycosyltransferase involved in cell wall biosynthesis